MELPEFRLNRIAKEIDNPLRNWGVGYTAEVMLQYAKEYHESELKKLRVGDVSVSVCDCGNFSVEAYSPCCSLSCWYEKFEEQNEH